MELSLIQEYALKIMTAFEDGSHIELISDSYPDLDMKDAYRIAEEQIVISGMSTTLQLRW